MQSEIRKHETRNMLTNLVSPLHDGRMVRAEDVAKALVQQGRDDLKRLRQIRSEQSKIRAQYNRFRDLEVEAKEKEARMRRTMSLLDNVYEDAEEQQDDFKAFVVTLSELTLWEAMMAVLEQVSEVQIYELQHVLDQLGKKVSRQAIESAIATHRNTFETKARGRDKFVSLKR